METYITSYVWHTELTVNMAAEMGVTRISSLELPRHRSHSDSTLKKKESSQKRELELHACVLPVIKEVLHIRQTNTLCVIARRWSH